jgi:methylamine dehydrogenase heavy chain
MRNRANTALGAARLAVVVAGVSLATVIAPAAKAQSYDSIVGDTLSLGEPDAHWFAVKAGETAYLVDGDAGEVRGTLTLSMFSPALEPDIERDRIFSYGSYYTRTFYGERTDVVLVYDLESTIPVREIEIPPKSAGIGHPGMIGLVGGRYVGVWNITPAMSVSLVDADSNTFVSEISTPGCAGVYPVDGGFLMACADGRVQFIGLDEGGSEVARTRSDAFFSVDEDPVFDYAVPAVDGWMFLSLEGRVFEVSVDGSTVEVSEAWAINPPDEEDAADLNGVPIEADDHWRIGGRQPFAYNAEAGLLVTLMHEGGGQETFEDAGTQIWAFSTETGRRAYMIEMEEGVKATSLELTADAEPLLLISTTNNGEVLVHDARSSRELRRISELGGSWGATLQRLQ